MTHDEAIIAAMDLVDNTIVVNEDMLYTELLSAIGLLMDDPVSYQRLAKVVRIGEELSGRRIHDVVHTDYDYGKRPIDMLAGSLYWGAGIIEWHPDHLAELAFTELVKRLLTLSP